MVDDSSESGGSDFGHESDYSSLNSTPDDSPTNSPTRHANGAINSMRDGDTPLEPDDLGDGKDWTIEDFNNLIEDAKILSVANRHEQAISRLDRVLDMCVLTSENDVERFECRAKAAKVGGEMGKCACFFACGRWSLPGL